MKEFLVEETAKGTFVPQGRDDILTRAIGSSEHASCVLCLLQLKIDYDVAEMILPMVMTEMFWLCRRHIYNHDSAVDFFFCLKLFHYSGFKN